MIPTVSPGRKAAGRTRSGWAKAVIEKDYLKRKIRRGRVLLQAHRAAIRDPTLRFAFRRERAHAGEMLPCRCESRQPQPPMILSQKTSSHLRHARRTVRRSHAH